MRLMAVVPVVRLRVHERIPRKADVAQVGAPPDRHRADVPWRSDSLMRKLALAVHLSELDRDALAAASKNAMPGSLRLKGSP